MPRASLSTLAPQPQQLQPQPQSQLWLQLQRQQPRPVTSGKGSEQLRLLLGEPFVVSAHRLVETGLFDRTELDFAAIAACGVTPEGGARLPHGDDAQWGRARRRAAPPRSRSRRCKVTHHAMVVCNFDSLSTSYLPSVNGSVHMNTYRFVMSRM